MRPDGTLEIVAVRASDVGDYTCSVVSPGGNETRSARLSVIELPFAPINVVATRVERISPRTINVTWVPGFDGNSPTKKFIVQKLEVSDLGKCDPGFFGHANVMFIFSDLKNIFIIYILRKQTHIIVKKIAIKYVFKKYISYKFTIE